MTAGEACVVIGEGTVLFCRRAQVFEVWAPDLAAARQLALELDRLALEAGE